MERALNQATDIKYTDIVLVAKVHSLQRLPHYTFQLSLRYPAENNGQRNIDCSQKNKTKPIYKSRFPHLLFQSFLKRIAALKSPLVTQVTLGRSLTATAPLFSGAARVSAAQPCGKRKNGQTVAGYCGLDLSCDFTSHKLN